MDLQRLECVTQEKKFLLEVVKRKGKEEEREGQGRGEEGQERKRGGRQVERGEMEGRSHSILWTEMRTLAFALSETKGTRGF